MSDPLSTSKELPERLTNRLCTSITDEKVNQEMPTGPGESKSQADGGLNGEPDVFAGEHWLTRSKRNAFILGESLAGKVNDMMSLSIVGLTASKEAAGTLAAGIKSKAFGLLPSNNDFNIDKDKPAGLEDDGCNNDGVPRQHWLKTRNGRKLLLYGGAAAAGAGAVAAAPVVLGAIGFGPGGIAAGSVGAEMMSKAAITGLGAGLISTLQSAGAAGLAGATKLLISGGVASGVVLAAGKPKKNEGGDEGGQLPPMSTAASNTERTLTADSAIETTKNDKIPLSRL